MSDEKPATPSPATMENFLLQEATWVRGKSDGLSVFADIGRVSHYSLPVKDLTPEQRKSALEVLKVKYEIDGTHITRDSRGEEVMRVVSSDYTLDMEKLEMARHLANPKSWTEIDKNHPSKIITSMLDLDLHDALPQQISYVQRLFEKWGVESTVAPNAARGGTQVLRIHDEGSIDNLREQIPSVPATKPPRRAPGSAPTSKPH